MKNMIKKFYENGATGLFHSGNYDIHNWIGNLEFQIGKGNDVILNCYVDNGVAKLVPLREEGRKILSSVSSIVSQYHTLAAA